MKNSVKNLMPIPKGYVVLTKETTSRGVTWGSQEYNGYNFRLAEYADGTTALYHVYPDGSIKLDCESVLVQELYCMHCGEPLNPCLDADAGIPDPHEYFCAACGHDYEIGGEDE